MTISTVIEAIKKMMGRAQTRLTPIPGLLLTCTCARRPGFSALLTSAAIYANMQQNEYDDIVKKFVYNVVEKIKMNIQDDGVCFVIIPPGELNLKLTGGNAGGPVVLEGTNINYVFTWAIIR